MKYPYTRIANHLIEAIYKNDSTGTTLRVLLYMIRTSYGFNRKTIPYKPIRDIGKDINMSKTSVSLALEVLSENGILFLTETGDWGINKDAILSPCPIRGTSNSVPTTGQIVPSTGHTPYSKDNLKKGDVCPNYGTKSKKFIPPTIQQIKDYCIEKKSSVNPEKFYNHYQASNWMRGKTKIVSWKHCIATWEGNSFQSSPQKQSSPNYAYLEAKANSEHGK